MILQNTSVPRDASFFDLGELPLTFLIMEFAVSTMLLIMYSSIWGVAFTRILFIKLRQEPLVLNSSRDILDYVGLEVPKIAMTGVPLCSIEDKIEAVKDGA